MLFRAARPLAKLARPPVAAPSLLSRTLATEASPSRPPASKEYATVEDLHNRTAHEILAGTSCFLSLSFPRALSERGGKPLDRRVPLTTSSLLVELTLERSRCQSLERDAGKAGGKFQLSGLEVQ